MATISSAPSSTYSDYEIAKKLIKQKDDLELSKLAPEMNLPFLNNNFSAICQHDLINTIKEVTNKNLSFLKIELSEIKLSIPFLVRNMRIEPLNKFLWILQDPIDREPVIDLIMNWVTIFNNKDPEIYKEMDKWITNLIKIEERASEIISIFSIGLPPIQEEDESDPNWI